MGNLILEVMQPLDFAFGPDQQFIIRALLAGVPAPERGREEPPPSVPGFTAFAHRPRRQTPAGAGSSVRFSHPHCCVAGVLNPFGNEDYQQDKQSYY